MAGELYNWASSRRPWEGEELTGLAPKDTSGEYLLLTHVNKIWKVPRSSHFFDLKSDTFLPARGTGDTVVPRKMLLRILGPTHTMSTTWHVWARGRLRQLWSHFHSDFSIPVCFFFLCICVFSCSFTSPDEFLLWPLSNGVSSFA